MKWDKTINIILFFVFLALLSNFWFEPVILYGQNLDVAIGGWQFLFSIIYALLWLALIVYSAWQKKKHFVIAGLIYCFLAALPGWFLPSVVPAAGAEQGLLEAFFEMVLKKAYALSYAPLTGFGFFMSLESVKAWTSRIFPVFLAAYLGTQIFRYYRNAYIAQRLHMDTSTEHKDPVLARELGVISEVAGISELDVKRVSDNTGRNSFLSKIKGVGKALPQKEVSEEEEE